MKKTIILAISALLGIAWTASAQKWEFRVKSGVNIGGTAPIPLAPEIRKIKSYSPSLSLMLGGEAIVHLNDKWALQTGLKLETKGMSTKAGVKNYHIKMNVSEGGTTGSVTGLFTGNVNTTVKNDYLTMPLTAVYKISPRWDINAGMFVSLLLKGNFTGKAHNGYIRSTPIDEMVEVYAADYDFSGDIRKINWGGQLGARWQAYRQFSVFGDLAWAANSIFKKDFNSISFDMYNIYLNLGFAYTF